MPVSPIEKEFRDITGLKPKPGQTRAAFLSDLIRAGQSVPENDWDSLTDPAQKWYNDSIVALKASKNDPASIPDPADIEVDEVAEEEPEAEAEADGEEAPEDAEAEEEPAAEEDEPEAEAEPEDEPEAEEPAPARRAPARAAAPARKAAAPPARSPAPARKASPPPAPTKRPPSPPQKPGKTPPKGPPPKNPAKGPVPKTSPRGPAPKTPARGPAPPARPAPRAPAPRAPAPKGPAPKGPAPRKGAGPIAAPVSKPKGEPTAGAQNIVKRLLIKNINAPVTECLLAVEKAGKKVSRLTVAQCRSDFRNSVSILQEAQRMMEEKGSRGNILKLINIESKYLA